MQVAPRLGGFRPEADLLPEHDVPPPPSFSVVLDRVVSAGRESSDAYYIVRRALDNPPSDQRALSSCVGNGVCDSLEILMPARVDLSRLFVYWNARRLNGDERQDSGSYIRLAAQSVVDHGVCREAAWPYEEASVLERPDLFAYEEAYDHRLGYSPILGAQLATYRISSRGGARADEVEAAVRADHPVVLGADVGQPFVDYFDDATGADVAWDAPSHPVGKHCMAVVGVRRTSTGRMFLLRNSWGPNGLAEYPGHAWMRESWLAVADDLTVLTIGPTFG